MRSREITQYCGRYRGWTVHKVFDLFISVDEGGIDEAFVGFRAVRDQERSVLLDTFTGLQSWIDRKRVEEIKRDRKGDVQ